MLRSIYRSKPLFLLMMMIYSGLLSAQEKKQKSAIEEVSNWLDNRINRAIVERHASGFNVGIMIDGVVSLEKGYGLKNIESKEVATKNTTYQIGSITKTFVAALAAKLHSNGTIDLDEPIEKYVPELEFHSTIEPAKISLRVLLTHFSGWPRNAVNRRNIKIDGLTDYFDPTIAETMNIDDLKYSVAHTARQFETSEEYHYSNFAYDLAAYVLAKSSGHETFIEALREHILKPLNLSNTDVKVSKGTDEYMATPYASEGKSGLVTIDKNVHKKIELPAWQFGEVTGALGLTSNVSDLSKYILHLMSLSNKVNMPLTQQGRALLFEKNNEFIKDGTHLVGIGLGWRIDPLLLDWPHEAIQNKHHD